MLYIYYMKQNNVQLVLSKIGRQGHVTFRFKNFQSMMFFMQVYKFRQDRIVDVLF